jgi:hypothetical protein
MFSYTRQEWRKTLAGLDEYCPKQDKQDAMRLLIRVGPTAARECITDRIARRKT